MTADVSLAVEAGRDAEVMAAYRGVHVEFVFDLVVEVGGRLVEMAWSRWPDFEIAERSSVPEAVRMESGG